MARGGRSAPAPGQPSSPLWLSHHHPDAYDRCAVIAGARVCRRCALLWPLTLVVMVLALVGPRLSGVLEALALAALPLPAVAEFVLEHLRRIRYRPRLQATVTVPLGAALGLGLGRYLRRPSDLLFWGIVAAYGTICGASVVLGR